MLNVPIDGRIANGPFSDVLNLTRFTVEEYSVAFSNVLP